MTLNTLILQKIIHPKHRKGATEEHIFADNQKAKKTQRLMAELGVRTPLSRSLGRKEETR